MTVRDACRHCGGRRLDSYLALPPLPLTDAFLRRPEDDDIFVAPIEIFLCADCGLSQIRHDVRTADYYRDYSYSAASSELVQAFMDELAGTLWRDFALAPGDPVIEIGSGDGHQLKKFQNRGARVLGFEPSEPLCRSSRSLGVAVIPGLFDRRSLDAIPAAMRPVRLALLTYTFDHLPEPRRFLADALSALDPVRGLLVIEVHDLDKIFARREFCLFEHEHSVYPTAATLHRMLGDAGFAVVSFGVVPEGHRRGNSLVAVATPAGSALAERALPPPPLGPASDLSACRAFGQSIGESIDRLRRYVDIRKAQGRRLAGYGAGGRGVMTMAAIARPGAFEYVCDQNTAFHGWYTPGAKVPVCPPERLNSDPVDEVIVFSFGYLAEIRRALAPYLARGGRLTSLLEIL